MKKVFACLSAITLMLVAFGFVMQPANVSAAEVEEGKFIVDPTLEEDEIPLYVMNSIRSSFPHLYDFNAQADPNYGLGRDYYWNEIKLSIPQFDASGATGKRYSVYSQGTYDAAKGTAANTKIYLWMLDDEGKVVTATNNNGTHSYSPEGYGPLFGDVSLSGIRYNITGQDIVMNNLYTENGIINGASAADGFKYGGGHYNTDPIYLIFDGQGKAVRGAAQDSYYNAEYAAQYGFNSLLGKKDGVIVIREDVAGGAAVYGLGAADAELDKVQIAVPNPDDPVLDDFGDPVVDENGDPMYNDMYIDSEDPEIVYGTRYVWQWYSEEDFANQEVNTVGYLQEGWLDSRWDYAYADPNGGYVCIKLTTSLGKYDVASDDECRVHNASVRAMEAAGELSADEAAALLIPETETTDEETGVTTITYGVYRSPRVYSLVVPAGAIMYRYGYLDYSGVAVTEMHLGKYCALHEDALLYGRHADYQAYARTYNFTATGLVAENVVYDNESFIVREEAGKLVVEIKEGAKVVPSEIVSILGMLGGYSIAGAPTKEAGSNVAAVDSYKQSDAAGLSYYMDIDGKPTMRPVQYQYETAKDAAAAFMHAIAKFIGLSGYTLENWSGGTYGKFTDDNIAAFFEANPDWNWFKDFYQAYFDEKATAEGFTGYTAWAPNGLRFGLHALYGETKWGSWPYSPDFSTPASVQISDYSPEVSYRYNNWEEFVADFIKDFNAFVYGKEQVTSSVDFWDMSYTDNADLQAKIIEFFTTEDWAWFGAELDKGIAASGWTSYGKDHYYYYRCNVYEYLNKTQKTNWPASCGAFHEMADPSWIGTILEKDFYKVEFDASAYNLFDSFDMFLEVTNSATGIVDKMEITFQVVKHATPIIKVNEEGLMVKAGQTSINLKDIVSAWDCEYKESGNGVYGSDISRQYLTFEYEEGFDPQNLKAGSWTVKAIAKAPEDTGLEVSTTFVVNVPDTTAPELRLVNKGQIFVQAGKQINYADVVAYAIDNVDGDYLRNAEINWNWCVINSDYDPEYSVPGEVLDGTVTVYDKTGNSTKANFSVTVTGVVVPEVDFSPIEDAIEGIEMPEAYDDAEVMAKLAEIMAELQKEPAQPESAGCVAMAYASSFIAAAGLALLILKKRH